MVDYPQHLWPFIVSVHVKARDIPDAIGTIETYLP